MVVYFGFRFLCLFGFWGRAHLLIFRAYSGSVLRGLSELGGTIYGMLRTKFGFVCKANALSNVLPLRPRVAVFTQKLTVTLPLRGPKPPPRKQRT